jgi:hypothetical protein
VTALDYPNGSRQDRSKEEQPVTNSVVIFPNGAGRADGNSIGRLTNIYFGG